MGAGVAVLETGEVQALIYVFVGDGGFFAGAFCTGWPGEKIDCSDKDTDTRNGVWDGD
jgi:hypothetical protein